MFQILGDLGTETLLLKLQNLIHFLLSITNQIVGCNFLINYTDPNYLIKQKPPPSLHFKEHLQSSGDATTLAMKVI